MSNVKPHLILREKWLTALENNTYNQERGALYHPHIKGKMHVCAIGAAGMLMEEDYPNYTAIREAYKLKEITICKILDWNDVYKLSFPEIATRLRANPSWYFQE